MNSASPSGEDVETFEESWPDADFAVMFILASDDSHSARLKTNVKGLRSEYNIPVKIKWDAMAWPFDCDELYQELDDKCTDCNKVVVQSHAQQTWGYRGQGQIGYQSESFQGYEDDQGYYAQDETGDWVWVPYKTTAPNQTITVASAASEEEESPVAAAAKLYPTAMGLGLTASELVKILIKKRKGVDAALKKAKEGSEAQSAIQEHKRLYTIATYAKKMGPHYLDKYSAEARAKGLTHLEAFFNEWKDFLYLENAGDSSDDATVQEQIEAYYESDMKVLALYGDEGADPAIITAIEKAEEKHRDNALIV